MNRIFVATALLVSSAVASAQSAQPVHSIVEAGDVAWGAAPPSLPPGAQAAVLHGNPAQPGLFVLRLKLPPGYRIPPHTHPGTEVVTVLSGAFNVGMGPTGDPAMARRLSAGSFFAFGPGMAHYAHVTEETVVQISTNGPWGITYVNPADDPRQQPTQERGG